MILTVTALLLVSFAVILFFWNQIRESYLAYFSLWIKEHCGEKIKNICDCIFASADILARTARRSSKQLALFLQNVLKKYDIFYQKIDSEHTEIKESVVVRQKDGSFVKKEVKRSVDNDEIPLSVLEELYRKDSEVYYVDGKGIIEKKIKDCLEN